MPPLASSADRRVRVLVNGFGAYHGGIVRVHNAICRELVDMGYDVSVANAPRDQVQIEGLKILSQQSASRVRSMLADLRHSLRVRRFDLRVDSAPAFRLFTPSRRRVVVIHDLNFLDPATHAISKKQLAYRRVLHAWTLRRANVLVVNSEATRQEVESFYPSGRRKVRVMPLPVDLPTRGRRWAPRPSDGTVRLLTFGHARNKGVDRLLRMLAHHPEAWLRVVSPVSLWDEYWSALAADLEVDDRVTVLEGLTDEDVVREYLACDAFCMLSTYEGYGLPVVEALSLGVPTVISSLTVLASTSRGYAEVVASPDPDADFAVIQRAVARSSDHWRTAAEAIERSTWRGWTSEMLEAGLG